MLDLNNPNHRNAQVIVDIDTMTYPLNFKTASEYLTMVHGNASQQTTDEVITATLSQSVTDFAVLAFTDTAITLTEPNMAPLTLSTDPTAIELHVGIIRMRHVKEDSAHKGFVTLLHLIVGDNEYNFVTPSMALYIDIAHGALAMWQPLDDLGMFTQAQAFERANFMDFEMALSQVDNGFAMHANQASYPLYPIAVAK